MKNQASDDENNSVNDISKVWTETEVGTASVGEVENF